MFLYQGVNVTGKGLQASLSRQVFRGFFERTTALEDCGFEALGLTCEGLRLGVQGVESR